MGYLTEKVAYLRGLAEGMKIDEKTDEGKVIAKLLEVLEEMSQNIDDISSEITETEERIDDLEEFADEVYEELYDDEGCDCEHCHGEEDEEEDEDYDFLDDYDEEDGDDVDFYEIICPHCSEKVYFDEDMVKDGNLSCPNCKAEINLED